MLTCESSNIFFLSFFTSVSAKQFTLSTVSSNPFFLPLFLWVLNSSCCVCRPIFSSFLSFFTYVVLLSYVHSNLFFLPCFLDFCDFMLSCVHSNLFFLPFFLYLCDFILSCVPSNLFFLSLLLWVLVSTGCLVCAQSFLPFFTSGSDKQLMIIDSEAFKSQGFQKQQLIPSISMKSK